MTLVPGDDFRLFVGIIREESWHRCARFDLVGISDVLFEMADPHPCRDTVENGCLLLCRIILLMTTDAIEFVK